MVSILLIGAGQLGSRYLQGLARIESPLDILVVDPSNQSLGIAKERLAEVESSTHSIRFLNSIAEGEDPVDLCIITTPAHCRSEVVSTISAQHEVNAWILEKVLAQSSQQVDQIERALAVHPRVWVNTPRRLMAWHQEIKAQLLASGPVSLRVRISGGNWGLACNAIHFIDLVSWWTGENVDSVDGRGLGDWKPSKRSGFQEVFGSLMVHFRYGSSLELICNQSDAAPSIEVETPQGIWLIEEMVGKAVGPSGQEITGQLSFQSALTAPLVEQILTFGRCELPSLADSAAQHRPFLDALLQHWNQSHSRQVLAVPIT